MKTFYVWLMISALLGVIAGITYYSLVRRRAALLENESKESDKSERSRCRHALMLVLAIGAVVFFVVFLVMALTDWRM